MSPNFWPPPPKPFQGTKKEEIFLKCTLFKQRERTEGRYGIFSLKSNFFTLSQYPIEIKGNIFFYIIAFSVEPFVAQTLKIWITFDKAQCAQFNSHIAHFQHKMEKRLNNTTTSAYRIQSIVYFIFPIKPVGYIKSYAAPKSMKKIIWSKKYPIAHFIKPYRDPVHL